MSSFESVLIISLIVSIITIVLNMKAINRKKKLEREEMEKKNQERDIKCGYIKAAILPCNVGKSITLVKENISQTNISTKFHL